MGYGRLSASLLVLFALAPAGASAATYTVSPSGQDTAAGSSAKPFRTIARAARAARAGDTVNVMSGIYAETVSLTSANSGATFRGVGATRPVVDGGKTRARGFDNNGANQLTIENFEIKGQAEAGIFTAGSNNTIAGNVIHHVGSPSVRESQGVRVNRGSGNRVAGNTIHHIGPGSESRGIWLLESRDGIVEENVTYLIRKEGIRDWKGLDNTLRRNRSFLNWVGIALGTTTGATVVDNLVYENTQGIVAKHLSYSRVLDYWGLATGRWSKVSHNSVFRSSDASVWIAQSEDPLDYLEVTDNSFSGAGVAFLRDAPSIRGPHVIVDRNAYSDVGGKPRYVYKAGYSSNPGLLSWDLVRSLLGWELNAASADAGARGMAVADPKYTPYKMTPVDSSSKGTYWTNTHLDKTSDDIQNTYWLTATNSNEHVSFDFGKQQTFNHLQLTIYSDQDLRNPRNVRFEVWDGSAWKVVHRATNPDPGGSAYYYELDQPVTARFLKMTLIDTFGGDYFVVSDLEAGLLGSTAVPVPAESTPTSPTESEKSLEPSRSAEPAPAPAPSPVESAAPPARTRPTGERVVSRRVMLRATRRKARRARARKVVLKWSGVLSDRIDVYRNGAKVATTANDGAQTYRVKTTGARTYRYRVCEAGTDTCSKPVAVVFRRRK